MSLKSSLMKSPWLGVVSVFLAALLTATVAWGADGRGIDPKNPTVSDPTTLPFRKTPGHVPVRPIPLPPTVPEKTETVKGPGDSLRTAGILTSMAGTAILGAGILYHLTYREQKKDRQEGKVPWSPESQQNLDDAKVYAQVGYGLGAAVLCAGATLYYFGWRKDWASRPSVAPVVAPGVVGLNLRGQF